MCARRAEPGLRDPGPNVRWPVGPLATLRTAAGTLGWKQRDRIPTREFQISEQTEEIPKRI